MNEKKVFTGTNCPLPIADGEFITLAHGGGGRITEQLIREVFQPIIGNSKLGAEHDGAFLEHDGGKLAFTTDSHVVRPLFFPGGDIGKLAVYGTVNDLAVCGARPLALSIGVILEEGFSIEQLKTIVASIGEAAKFVGVEIVTADTKVVERGKGDGMYINTSGIGSVIHELSPQRIAPGDVVILSGDIGRHGIAVMASREGLSFDTRIRSDCASITAPLETLLRNPIDVHCARDCTRGGLATAIIELASTRRVDIEIDEAAIAVLPEVRGACELLGLDPLYVANEGRFVCFVHEEYVAAALSVLQRFEVSKEAVVIGRVGKEGPGRVELRNTLGTKRLLDKVAGEQLPRIC